MKRQPKGLVALTINHPALQSPEFDPYHPAFPSQEHLNKSQGAEFEALGHSENILVNRDVQFMDADNPMVIPNS